MKNYQKICQEKLNIIRQIHYLKNNGKKWCRKDKKKLLMNKRYNLNYLKMFIIFIIINSDDKIKKNMITSILINLSEQIIAINFYLNHLIVILVPINFYFLLEMLDLLNRKGSMKDL